MIWRAAYQTRAAQSIDLPELTPVYGTPVSDAHVLLGGFSFEALREIAIWQRLIKADAPHWRPQIALFRSNWSPESLDQLVVLVPRSDLAKAILAADSDGSWQQLIQPARSTESFAARIEGRFATIVMKGLPTEEAWEAFLSNRLP